MRSNIVFAWDHLYSIEIHAKLLRVPKNLLSLFRKWTPEFKRGHTKKKLPNIQIFSTFKLKINTAGTGVS